MSRIRDMARPIPELERAYADRTPVEVEPPPLGLDIAARIAAVDQVKLRADRLARLRAELAKRDFAGALLSDPMNIRYATGTRNMAVWTMHAPGRYAFVATDGPVVLFEFGATKHVSRGVETVDAMRTSTPWFYFLCGPRVEEKAQVWAEEVASLVRRHGGGNARLAVDRCEPWGAELLECHHTCCMSGSPFTTSRRRWSRRGSSRPRRRSSAFGSRWTSATSPSSASAGRCAPA